MNIVATRAQRIEKDIRPGEVRGLVESGFVIDEVDGRECIGMCEICWMPIVEGESCLSDSDGITWHEARGRG